VRFTSKKEEEKTPKQNTLAFKARDGFRKPSIFVIN
jgi:hypothetical protein